MSTGKQYKVKQEWMDAVMASDLSPATKVYAYGVFKHMFGIKTDAWPGAKGLSEATGLNDSQFYKYNAALSTAGFIEVTSRKGRSNEYVLVLPTSTEGRYLPPERVTLPSERVGGTSTEGTNTTSNTTMDTTTQDNNESLHVADAPVGKSRYSYIRKDDHSSSNCDSTHAPVYFMDLEGVTGPLNCDSEEADDDLYPVTEDGQVMNGTYWRELRKQRSLTKEEKDLINRQSAAYMASKRKPEPAVDEEAW